MPDEIDLLKEKLRQERTQSKKAEILLEIGKHYLKTDLKEAKRIALQALTLAKRSKERKTLAKTFNFYANILRLEGNFEEGMNYAQKALKVAEVEGDKLSKINAFNILGLINQAKGDLDSGLACHKEAFLLAKEINNETEMAIAYNNLSLIHWYRGELPEALEYQKRSLAIKEAKGEISAIAVSRINLGVIYEDLGEWEEATECFYRALEGKEKMKDFAGVALCYNNIGEIYLKRGKLEKATNLFETAISYSEKIGSLPRKMEALSNLGETKFFLGDTMRAMNLYVEAIEIGMKINQKDELAKAYRRMGELLLQEKEIKEAENFLLKALALCSEIGMRKEEGNIRKALGKLFWTLGEKEKAKNYFQESSAIFKGLGIKYELAKTYAEFGKFLVENYEKEIGLPYLREAERIFRRLEIFPEVENLERYLYHLERDEDKGLALLRSLSIIAVNPSPLPEFCPRILNLLKELLALEGCALYFDDRHFAVGKVKKGEGTTIPLLSGRERIGTLHLKLPPSPQFALTEAIKETLANLLVIGLEKAKGLTICKPPELAEEEKIPFEGIIGKTAKMREICDIIKKVAPTKAPVLIRGESGTGKELVARSLHNLSFGPEKPFIPINCAAIPETLLESELFGVEKGTATGVSEKEGKFEIAAGGTLFLDEIGDMSLSLQAKILRVLQEKKFFRVGGKKPIEVDVRIIAATNQNLEKKVAEGKFREDLFYRLNVVSLTLPPLRERKEDIPLLVDYFRKKYNKEFQKECQGGTEEVMERLLVYDWPGNIRELENVVERGIILAKGDVLTLSDLPPYLQEISVKDKEIELSSIKTKVKREVANSEKEIIQKTLESTNWDVTKAAKKLSISRRHLYRLMAKYNIKRQKNQGK